MGPDVAIGITQTIMPGLVRRARLNRQATLAHESESAVTPTRHPGKARSSFSDFFEVFIRRNVLCPACLAEQFGLYAVPLHKPRERDV
jgi:hypothetical protein